MGTGVRIAIASATVVTAAATLQMASAHPLRANRGSARLQPIAQSVARAQVPSHGPHVGSRGGTVLADAHGMLVVERNAGALIRTDRDGNPTAKLELHEDLGQVVSSGGDLVFVADRRAGKVLAVDAGSPTELKAKTEVEVAEPYGLALSPDSKTLYVTSVADHALVAVDTASMSVRWRTELRAEPRGVAVSADGIEATVGFLSSGALAQVDLQAKGEHVQWRALNPRDHVEVEEEMDEWGDEKIQVAAVREARGRFQVPTSQGRRKARSFFGVAYVGHGLVAAPHQISTSQMKRIPSADMRDSYGGGPEAIPAIEHRLALVGSAQGPTALSKLRLHQPRALAYDAPHDTLFVAGYGDDAIVAIAQVSQPAPYVAWTTTAGDAGKFGCGIDGLAVDGDDLWAHCELSRKLVRLTPKAFDITDPEWKREAAGVMVGSELAPSLRSAEVERGAELFRRGGDWRLSDSGVMACASCHPEGRQDGLSWRLGKSILQTPMLAGRVEGTAPFKWGGGDRNLTTSFKHTIERLGGSRDSISTREFRALAAYVQSLPTPQAPTVHDKAALARGRKLFNGDLDCITCHNGDKLTDGSQYPLDSRGLDETDTPSLIGLAHTAPYYHDGSAGDLYALLTDKGNVHDMADFSSLSKTQITDVITYLQSL